MYLGNQVTKPLLPVLGRVLTKSRKIKGAFWPHEPSYISSLGQFFSTMLETLKTY